MEGMSVKDAEEGEGCMRDVEGGVLDEDFEGGGVSECSSCWFTVFCFGVYYKAVV
jgi:hypothetical protein